MIEINKIYNQSCIDTMKLMPDNWLDTIITDPPYGYSFMGKDWDKVVPPVEIWAECLRVMKPGAFAFIMSAPRQDVLCHMISNLDKAGFDTSFTSIYWTYASGFPKAANISKLVDKKLGVDQNIIGKSYDMPDLRDVGKKSKDAIGIDKLSFNQVENANRLTKNITEATSPEAKELNGSYGGFQPKPAVEIIIVVMKPLSQKSYTEQALKDGKGVTWLDDCRIPYENNNSYEKNIERANQPRVKIGNGAFHADNSNESGIVNTNISADGRFPANLIVSDDVLNDGKIYEGQQGEVTGDEKSKFERGNTHGDYSGIGNSMQPREDIGSFSRYYDIDKWWNERIKALPNYVKEVFPFLIVPKAAKSEKNFGIDGTGKYMDEGRVVGSLGGSNPRNRGAETIRKNYHPTVKPVKLMSYLLTLATRENDIIFDPFAGSGTTLIAAHIINRKFIGAEINKEYCDIAQQRLKPFTAQTKLF